MPFKIALTPVTIFLSIFTLFNFGFFVAMNAITPAWLQRPEKVGGYGFTPFQNALCKSIARPYTGDTNTPKSNSFTGSALPLPSSTANSSPTASHSGPPSATAAETGSPSTGCTRSGCLHSSATRSVSAYLATASTSTFPGASSASPRSWSRLAPSASRPSPSTTCPSASPTTSKRLQLY